MKTKGFEQSSKAKDKFRCDIVKFIKDGDNIMVLESPKLLFLKELIKQNKKPWSIYIPNNREFVELYLAVQLFQKMYLGFSIHVRDRSSFEFICPEIDLCCWSFNNPGFDFIWLDYCAGFSFFRFELIKLLERDLCRRVLILTYNKFDPYKYKYKGSCQDYVENVLKIIELYSVRKFKVINHLTGDYKSNMYNIVIKFGKENK